MQHYFLKIDIPPCKATLKERLPYKSPTADVISELFDALFFAYAKFCAFVINTTKIFNSITDCTRQETACAFAAFND